MLVGLAKLIATLDTDKDFEMCAMVLSQKSRLQSTQDGILVKEFDEASGFKAL